MKEMIKRLFKSFLRIVIVLAVLIEILGIVFIDSFMFAPQYIRDRYTESSEGYVNLGDKDHVIAAVVLGPKKGKKAILRCHGNGENMYQSIGVLRELARRGFTVAGVDYPGYGLSSGKPTEKGCYQNVHRLYDWLVAERGFAPKDIIVDGFSIGTGSAVELAATKPVGGLILEAPFLSAPRAVTRVRLLPIDPFPNAERVLRKMECPLMILHGTDDHVVPFGQGRELDRLSRVNNSGSEDGKSFRWHRRFIPVEGADHDEIAPVLGIDAYLDLVADFAETICAKKAKEPVAEVATGDVDKRCDGRAHVRDVRGFEILKSYSDEGLCLLLHGRDCRKVWIDGTEQEVESEIGFVLEENGTLHPVEIKLTGMPRVTDTASFQVLDVDAVAGKKRGEGAIVCMCPTVGATERRFPHHTTPSTLSPRT